MQRRHAKKTATPRRKPKASSRDVLAPGPKDERIRPKFRVYYDRLVDLREQLSNRQSQLAKDALDERPGFSLHMADAGTDEYDRDLALGVLSSEQDAIYQIDQALDRIRAGTFGICELTGKPIDPARLEAVPWARFSAEAEKQFEKEGAVKRTRLGPRDTVAKINPGTEFDEEG
jgi:RNA polymerase-binding transcription factor DksA